MDSVGRWPSLLLLAAALGGGGCASVRRAPDVPPRASSAPEPTVVAETKYRDPLIGLNRAIFKFNDAAFRFVLIPASKGYTRAVPEPARKSVGNFFHNLKTPVYIVNDLLQLKPKAFARHLARFVVNSTAGVGGLFDPARAWLGLERTKTGFEETLARYGVGYGIYLVLPIYGSSSARGGVSLFADFLLNPIPYLIDDPASSAVMAGDNFQEAAPDALDYETLKRKLEDPYIFFRNLHLQGVRRDARYR